MKKQFARYKLKADQKVGRANKTEVLNDELLQIEKHIEHIRSACSTTNKKLQQCIQMNAGEMERRLKKLPETALATSMLEASNQLQSDSDATFSKTLKICAEAQHGVAKERALYEMFVELQVSAPLTHLVENQIPAILKLRERLKKLVLDRDHAFQTWQKAQKAQYTPGVNLPVAAAKAEQHREEFELAEQRMEQCKDQLITEMFEFVGKEAKYTEHLGDYVIKELDYHRRCVAHLEKLQPDLKSTLENATIRSCYGVPLSDHLRVTERSIAGPIEACVLCLVESGVYEEGIFRIAGGAAKLKKFRALVDAGVTDLMEYEATDDIHAVAGALKQYLRELPDPLLTQELFDDWLNCTVYNDNDQRLQEIWKVIDRMPDDNKNNLRYLMKFCAVLSQQKDYNKMNASNIALVLAPNLLWPVSSDISLNMKVTNQVSTIIESIITYCDWFFPEEIVFSLPPPPSSNYSGAVANSALDPNSSGHGRSLSGGAVAESTSPTIPTANNHHSPKHSRSSSTDFATVVNTATHASAMQAGGRKKRAPAPPKVSASQPPNPVDNNHSAKPPIASKRTSFKKPTMQPPEPPKPHPPPLQEESPPPEPKMPKPKTRSKPPPPARKRIPQAHHDSKIADEAQGEGPPLSPPMPDLPPPPLPSDLESSVHGGPGDGLLAELSLAQSKFTTRDHESSDEDQNTQL